MSNLPGEFENYVDDFFDGDRNIGGGSDDEVIDEEEQWDHAFHSSDEEIETVEVVKKDKDGVVKKLKKRIKVNPRDKSQCVICKCKQGIYPTPKAFALHKIRKIITNGIYEDDLEEASNEAIKIYNEEIKTVSNDMLDQNILNPKKYKKFPDWNASGIKNHVIWHNNYPMMVMLRKTIEWRGIKKGIKKYQLCKIHKTKRTRSGSRLKKYQKEAVKMMMDIDNHCKKLVIDSHKLYDTKKHTRKKNKIGYRGVGDFNINSKK